MNRGESGAAGLTSIAARDASSSKKGACGTRRLPPVLLYASLIVNSLCGYDVAPDHR